jgi:hypothetical protein
MVTHQLATLRGINGMSGGIDTILEISGNETDFTAGFSAAGLAKEIPPMLNPIPEANDCLINFRLLLIDIDLIL